MIAVIREFPQRVAIFVSRTFRYLSDAICVPNDEHTYYFQISRYLLTWITINLLSSQIVRKSYHFPPPTAPFVPLFSKIEIFSAVYIKLAVIWRVSGRCHPRQFINRWFFVFTATVSYSNEHNIMVWRQQIYLCETMFAFVSIASSFINCNSVVFWLRRNGMKKKYPFLSRISSTSKQTSHGQTINK